jgi:uncharacterized OsmC-like protein
MEGSMPSFTTTHEGHMLFSTRFGDRTVEVDAPPAMGGADRAPTAPQLMIAALGSCAASFAAQYCTQAGIDSEGLTVSVSFDVTERPLLFKDFKITLDLPNASCGPRRRALQRAMEQCPVHLTMEAFNGSEIEIRDRDDLREGAA